MPGPNSIGEILDIDWPQDAIVGIDPEPFDDGRHRAGPRQRDDLKNGSDPAQGLEQREAATIEPGQFDDGNVAVPFPGDVESRFAGARNVDSEGALSKPPLKVVAE